jgi:hypothetical protein
MALKDLRRVDQNQNILYNPYWIPSAQIKKAHDSVDCVLFSFPKALYPGVILIHDICVVCEAAFTDAGCTMNVGIGTILLDTTDESGDVTAVDADAFFGTADVDFEAGDITFPSSSDFLTAKAAGTWTVDNMLIPTDAVVPVIYANLSANSDIADSGAVRVCILASQIPAFNVSTIGVTTTTTTTTTTT